MRIAINAMPSYGYGGITYLRNILPVLDRLAGDHFVFVYGQPETISNIHFAARRIVFREVPVRAGIGGRLFVEQFRLPALVRSDEIDLVYTANNTDLVFAPRPRVTAIRYTEPFVFRKYHNSFSKQLRCAALWALTRLSLRTADHVICVSDYARRLVIGNDEELLGKSTVIHHGLGEPFRPEAPRPAWAPPEYLFTAAKMVGYSNLHTVAEALARCVSQGLDLPLFIAGGPHDAGYERFLKRRIRELGMTDRIEFLGYVDRESMAGGMAHARVFLFGSLLEACPNTLLEALGCGAAIVASDTEPNREVARDAAVWCDGNSATSMAAAIATVAGDPRLRSRLRGKALAEAESHSWERTAERLLRVLERVHRNAARQRAWLTPEEASPRFHEPGR